MQITAEGLALIKYYEGFRKQAYQDAVGVWTIGYGHTSMAGAPHVTPHLTITRDEADVIMARDVASFSEGVVREIKIALSDAQFSALVSFAYNVGLGNFKGSSVLAAVNREDFAAVPRRLNLWVKAGGQILPGLVKRRAAEAALFVGNTAAIPTSPVEIPKGKPMQQSKTVWSAMLAALLAAAQGCYLASFNLLFVGIALVIICFAAFIIHERFKKSTEEGV